MIGTIIEQGMIIGCRFDNGELYYLISQVNSKPGQWLLARQAVMLRNRQAHLHKLSLKQYSQIKRQA